MNYIKITEIDKKLENDNKQNGTDSLGNILCKDNVVRCVEGRNKGKMGVIKHIHKKILFLWDREFGLTNGLFVESSANV